MNLDYQTGFNAGTAFVRKYEVAPLVTNLRAGATALRLSMAFVKDEGCRKEGMEYADQMIELANKIASKDEQEIMPRF